jgi:aldose 1-epimerase
MSFQATIDDTSAFPIIRLSESSKTNVEIYTLGALLNQFYIKSKGVLYQVIDNYRSPLDAEINIGPFFKSAKLNPFVGRLRNGTFEFEGNSYKIKKFYLNQEAIHGLLFDALFTIQNIGSTDTEAFVTLQYLYNNHNEGFPFVYETFVTYKLSHNNCLQVTTRVVNHSASNMPLCDGWHPYFTFHASSIHHNHISVNTWLLKINSAEKMEFDERLLPTGKKLATTKFQQLQAIETTHLDDCFVVNNFNSPACILQDTRLKLQISILPDASYPYLQIFTPEHRKSIAIENLSAIPDAFHNKIGLKILAPQESFEFSTTYQASLL